MSPGSAASTAAWIRREHGDWPLHVPLPTWRTVPSAAETSITRSELAGVIPAISMSILPGRLPALQTRSPQSEERVSALDDRNRNCPQTDPPAPQSRNARGGAPATSHPGSREDDPPSSRRGRDPGLPPCPPRSGLAPGRRRTGRARRPPEAAVKQRSVVARVRRDRRKPAAVATPAAVRLHRYEPDSRRGRARDRCPIAPPRS